MKKRIPIVINKKDFEILCLIYQGKNYNEVIAGELKVKPASVIEHLKFLEKEGFLISKKEKKQFNKKIYSINKKRIAQEYAKDLRDSLINNLRKPITIYLKQFNVKKIIEKTNQEYEKIKNNPILIKYIETFFKLKTIKNPPKQIKEIHTLRDMFLLFYRAIDSQYFSKPKNKELQKLSSSIEIMISPENHLFPFTMDKETYDLFKKLLNDLQD